jgi:hypothetical protein
MKIILAAEKDIEKKIESEKPNETMKVFRNIIA